MAQRDRNTIGLGEVGALGVVVRFLPPFAALLNPISR